MSFERIYKYLENRSPVSRIPIDRDSTGYTSDTFNNRAGSPDFKGWTTDKSTEEQVKVITDLLYTEPVETLLDIACGYGRHDMLLSSQHGLKVTGIDISPGLITAAKRFAGERGLEITYEVRHARDLSFSNEFNCAMIADNSFSLFTQEDAAAVLHCVHRALVPYGRLFLDLDNKPYNCRYGISDTGWHTFPGGLILQEIYFHEDISVEVCRDLSFRTDAENPEEFIMFKRIYSEKEIVELLENCGFQVKHIFGGWDLSALTETSPKMILVVEKE